MNGVRKYIHKIIVSKRWSGQNLDDKKLLIIDEGSYSDLLQFIRLARELKKMDVK